ncbi:MAG: 4-(cytidine 5'-diphospho)-2-C-methyl-D-erythritol kinase [Candidatus Eisenbacteria sp.]|nr:4-(cytidine 5'-diphospho)-2-C-methyl-D-erythritol kinase [Candidatus Eisenbacteria bacterium]
MVRTFIAYAKFNLYLAILGRRPDGFHELDTRLQSIDLADRLECEVTGGPDLEIDCAAPEVPSGKENLVYQALARLRTRAGERRGMRVVIEKGIPPQAGLGGGSADAGCALCAANELWGLGWSPPDLEQLAGEIGSDVPFFIRGGAQRCRGRGERTEPVPCLPPSTWAIVKPPWGLATSAVYARVRSGLTSPGPESRMLLGNIAKRDLSSVLRAMFNDLEPAAMAIRPEAGEIKAWMLGLGMAGVVLAGSGSAWVGLCPDPDVAVRARREAGARGWTVFLAAPVPRGWIETNR